MKQGKSPQISFTQPNRNEKKQKCFSIKMFRRKDKKRQKERRQKSKLLSKKNKFTTKEAKGRENKNLFKPPFCLRVFRPYYNNITIT